MPSTPDGTDASEPTQAEHDVRALAAEMTDAVAEGSELSRKDLGHLLRHRWWSSTMQAVTSRVLVEVPPANGAFAAGLRQVLAKEGSVVAELEPKQRRVYQLLSAGRADLTSLLPDVPGGTRLAGRPLGADDLRAGYDLAEQIVRSGAPEQFVGTVYEVHLLRQLTAVVDSADDATFAELAEIAGRFAQRFKPYLVHSTAWPWTGSLTAALEHSVAAARDVVRLGSRGRASLVQRGRNRWSVVPEVPVTVTTPVSTVFRNESTLDEHVSPVPPLGAEGVIVPRAVLSGHGTWSVAARLDIDGVADVPLAHGEAVREAPARLTTAGGTDLLVLRSSQGRQKQRNLRGVTRPAAD